LSDLGNLRNDSVEAEESTTDSEHGERSSCSSAICERIAPLLQRYCIDTHLYLQHDLTLSQLARAVGTNRSYLGQYFSSQGTTYNAYINNLRINHFMNICREAVATRQPYTAQQLANDSGYRSYSTFSLAFKNRTGQSVTAWIRKITQ
jgi:AraC-like DNA-binding protein